MAITLGNNIEYEKDDKTKYLAENNIKDITKESLTALKADLPVDTETDLDSHIAEINDNVEKMFDWTLSNDREKSVTLTVNGAKITKAIKDIVMSWSQDELKALAQYAAEKSWYLTEIDKIENKDIQNTLTWYKFELNDLRKNINTTATTDIQQPIKDELNALLADETAWAEQQGFDIKEIYVQPWGNDTDAIPVNHKKIKNIYSDNDRALRKTMDDMFDDKDKDALSKRTFNINLGIEDWLAGIIIDIRKAIQYKDLTDKKDPNYKYTQIYQEFENLTEDENWEITLWTNKWQVKKQLNKLIDWWQLQYKRKWWLDSEIGKIAKIFTTTPRKTLDTFASLIESKSDIHMVIAEWSNAREATVDEGNVLKFLCDVNGDGVLSAAYQKKENEKQLNQWDVGTIFGQQIMFTINQAIDTKNVELGDKKWERLVIGNILKNMKISDRRNLPTSQLKLLNEMTSDPALCTKANLSKLINGYDEWENHVDWMPEFKIFFLDAIKKINGGSKEVQPDLYETLVGEDAQAIIDIKESKTWIKNALDGRLKDLKGITRYENDGKTETEEYTALTELIKKQWAVAVRETLFTKIMTILDNATITTNNGARTQLQSAGITKWRAVREAQKEFLEETVKKIIKGGIHYSREKGLRLTLGLGKDGISTSGRTKRSRWGEMGPIVSSQWVEIFMWLAWDIAEQYNYGTVINADLSEIHSAKYVGLEWQGVASVSMTRWAGVEVSGGFVWKQDRVAGINQINDHYRAVSEQLFDVRGLAWEDMMDKKKFDDYLKNKIKNYPEGKYKTFIEKNHKKLSEDVDFIVKYMDANEFFGLWWKINKLPNKEDAISNLIDILQSGNIEERRANVIAGLQGRIDITKLSFGVTSNIFTLKVPKSNKNAPTAFANWWETTEKGKINSWGTQSEVDLGQTRLGIFGFYVGARISTWKNTYVPHEQQYLYTQYEMWIGKSKLFENPQYHLEKYAQYLKAFYQSDNLTFNVRDNKLVIKFESGSQNPNLQQFLNLHATPEAMENFSLVNNTLTIWNVGDIWTYTVTEAKGASRTLCLWSTKLDEAQRITEDTDERDISPIEKKPDGHKAWSTIKIQSDIIDNMTTNDKKDTNLITIKKETAGFFDPEWKLISPMNATVTFEPETIKGQTFTTGTLIITKIADKKYTVQLQDTPNDKLTIKYRDEEAYKKGIENVKKSPNSFETKIIETAEIKKIFAMPINIKKVFVEQTEKILSKFDDKNKAFYEAFMESSLNTWFDSFIGELEYDDAFSNLKQILESHPQYNTLTDLKNLINSAQSIEEKMLIVDKFKTIFSYIIELTDGKNDYNDLMQNIKIRGLHYKTMVWPNGDKYPITTDYRTIIVNSLKWKTGLKRTRMDNLIGFTAFYKLNGNGQKYAMTPVGGTNVLTGLDWNPDKAMMTINNTTDKAKVQEWFIDNLNVNTSNKEMITKKINLLLLQHKITIQDQQLPILLKEGKVKLDSWEEISIDVNRVFYLLWECANESLWMEIKAITVKKLKSDIPIPGEYSASATPEPKYTSGINIWSKSHSQASKPMTQEVSVGVTHHRNRNTGQNSKSTSWELPTNNNSWGTNDNGHINAWTGASE